MPADDLKWAIASYGNTPYRQNLHLYNRYYDGDHRLAFSTEKFRSQFGQLFKEFADNLCPGVVDPLAERLKVETWTSTDAVVESENVPAPSGLDAVQQYVKVTVNDPIGEAADELWDRNEMLSRANEIHREAVKCGNSYLLVWPDENLKATFWPQTAAEMSVQYDANKLGVLARGCKVWWVPEWKKWRLNVYLPEQIEKYITTNQNPNGLPTEADSWVPWVDPDLGSYLVANPYGRVPVFHFANKGMYRPGISDLKDAIPIQDALNKSIIDMMVAMEFASYKQRYIIGLEVEIDEITGEPVDKNVREYGVDRLMAIPGDKNEIGVGQFDATDLAQFTGVSDKFRAEMSRVTGRPLHYFFITTGDFPSGEAIKSAEARFSGLIEDRQQDWGPVWGQAMKFALSIEQSVADDLVISPNWKEAAPRTEAELADSAIKKKAIGVSRSQLLKEMGYDDETIMRMLQEADALQMQEAKVQALANPKPEPGANTNSSGGQGTASKQGATKARSEGRVSGVKK